MNKYLTLACSLFLAAVAISFAAPTNDAMMEKEKAAWQAFKDKKEDGFKKVVDKDIKCVYADGMADMPKELSDMKKWDIKSFEISDFKSFSDEKDVVVSTYLVKVDGTYDGKDMSGTYNAGSVWKKEGDNWLAIFHTNIKQQSDTAASAKAPEGAQKKE